VTGCSREPTPSASDPLCKTWEKEHGQIDKYLSRHSLDEIVILEKDNGGFKKSTVCYRSKPGKRGWCGTTKFTLKKGEHHGMEDREPSSSSHWGFCSDECSLDEKVALSGRARHKEVTIIEHKYCYAQTLHRIQKQFTVEPKVYCVAFNHTYATEYYVKEDSGFVKQISGIEKYGEQFLERKDHFIIKGTGSCQGDSGGPLYVEHSNVDDKAPNVHRVENKDVQYVVIGITSRGSGKLGNCGGADNPTHYVRVKDFIKWITRYVPEDELCLIN